MPVETPLYEAAASPLAVEPMTGMRGIVAISGRRVLQARGRFDDYEAFVPAEHRTALATVTAGEVLPMSLAHVHVGAIDRLGLSRDEARSLGGEMSRAMHGIVFSTIVRLGGQLGASPWLVFSKAPKVWARMYCGGAVAIFRRDERAARVAVWGDPLARYALHREAVGGGLLHVVEACCTRPVMYELTEYRTPAEFSFLIRW